MKKILLIGYVLLTLISCGYQFQGGGSILPPDIKNIYIPIVQNNSGEQTLGTLLTEALRDQFDRYGVVNVVDEQKQADATLFVKVLKLKRATDTVTGRTDTALQLNSTIDLSGELKKRDGSFLWKNPRLSVNRSFGTSGDVVVTSSSDFAQSGLGASDLGALSTRELARAQEQEALNIIAEQAARRIYDEAVAPDF